MNTFMSVHVHFGDVVDVRTDNGTTTCFVTLRTSDNNEIVFFTEYEEEAQALASALRNCAREAAL